MYNSDMNDDANRKPVVPVIATLLIMLPMVYVAMFGPAVCMNKFFDKTPTWLDAWIHAPDPADWIIESLPEQPSQWLKHLYYGVYLTWWHDLGVHLAGP